MEFYEQLLREYQKEQEMEVNYYAVELSNVYRYLELYVLSDLHYGNPYCNVRKFINQLDYVAENPNVFIILNGDLCESAIKTSKGDIFKQAGSPRDQRDWMIKVLKPIKHKILGMTTGNHEDRITKDTSMDISADIADALKVPYDPDGLYLKLSFGNRNRRVNGRPFTYWINTSHGYGGARTKSAKAVKAERLGYMMHADVVAMSHDHVVNAAPDVVLIPDPRANDQYKNHEFTGFKVGKVKAHRKELVKTNAFLKWGGYARKGGFSPSDLITPTIWLAGEEKPWPGVKKNDFKPEARVIV